MQSTKSKRSPRLTQLSYGLAFLTTVGMIACIFYSLYLINRPCVYGYHCEAPPIFFFFIFICGFMGSLNFIGVICAWLASDPQRPIKRQRKDVIWNAVLLGLCVIYLAIVLLLMTLGF